MYFKHYIIRKAHSVRLNEHATLRNSIKVQYDAKAPTGQAGGTEESR